MATSFDSAKFLRDNRTKALGFGVFTVVMVIILVAGAIVPSLSAVIKLQSEISQKKFLYDKLETKVTALSKLSQQIDNAENLEAFNNLPMLFPADKDYSLALLYINDLTETYKYDLVSISFPLKATSNNSESPLRVLESQAISLSIRGPIVNLVGYLKALEALPMYPTVENISYSNNPDRDGNYSISITLTVYEVGDTLFYK